MQDSNSHTTSEGKTRHPSPGQTGGQLHPCHLSQQRGPVSANIWGKSKRIKAFFLKCSLFWLSNYVNITIYSHFLLHENFSYIQLFCLSLVPAVVSQSECRCAWTAHHSACLSWAHFYAGPGSVCITHEVNRSQFYREGPSDEWQSEHIDVVFCFEHVWMVLLHVKWALSTSQSVGNKNGRLWTADDEVSPEVLAKVKFILSNQVWNNISWWFVCVLMCMSVARCKPLSCWSAGCWEWRIICPNQLTLLSDSSQPCWSARETLQSRKRSGTNWGSRSPEWLYTISKAALIWLISP